MQTDLTLELQLWIPVPYYLTFCQKQQSWGPEEQQVNKSLNTEISTWEGTLQHSWQNEPSGDFGFLSLERSRLPGSSPGKVSFIVVSPLKLSSLFKIIFSFYCSDWVGSTTLSSSLLIWLWLPFLDCDIPHLMANEPSSLGLLTQFSGSIFLEYDVTIKSYISTLAIKRFLQYWTLSSQ